MKQFVPDTGDVILNGSPNVGDRVVVRGNDSVRPAILLSKGFPCGSVCYSRAETKENCKLCVDSGKRPPYCKISI